jgi:hypothetical protein
MNLLNVTSKTAFLSPDLIRFLDGIPVFQKLVLKSWFQKLAQKVRQKL